MLKSVGGKMLKKYVIASQGTCVGGFIFLSFDKKGDEVTPLEFFTSLYSTSRKPVVLIHNSQTELLMFVRADKVVSQFLACPIFPEGDYQILLFRHNEAYTFYREETTREYQKQKRNGEELCILENRKIVADCYEIKEGDMVRYLYFPYITCQVKRPLPTLSYAWSIVCTDEYLEKKKMELAKGPNK